MKQCPQCRRSYDDSQSFCLMDGTALIDEPEQETAVRQTPAPRKKSKLWLWIALSALLVFIFVGLAGALLIYKFVGRNDNTLVKNNANVKSSPAKTTSSTPKTTTLTPEAANNSTVTNTSTPQTEKSPDENNDSDEEITPIDWSTGGNSFKNDVGMTYKFRCPPNGEERAIWGSDIYTADSSICTAAVHAGLFSIVDGGVVTVEFRPGRLTYGSTTRNGIKSNTFGEYNKSFVVR
jgi:hypothetical protein